MTGLRRQGGFDGIRQVSVSSRIAALVLLAAATVSAGCDGSAPPHTASAPTTPAPTASTSPTTGRDSPTTRAAARAAALADEDLVGQVLVPYAYGSSATKVSAASAAGNRKMAGVDTPAEMIARYRLGGLILVGFSADDPTSGSQPTTNVDSPAQVRALTGGLQAAAGRLPAKVPLLVGTDQEYGVVTRIKDGVTALPSAMAFGAAGQPGLTAAAWRAAGTELAALGVTVDFAPDADVLGSAGSTVIGSRSFGSDPRFTADQVAATVRGLQGAGVAAALKHFPGHGHTSGDSHDGLPVLGQSRTELDREDLPPFAAGIAAGAWLVMSGHLDTRSVDPGMPASFSHKVLTDVLRGQLGFTGVVVTDAMNMPPAKRWSPGEAAVRALNAGNDLLLMPENLPATYDGLLAAVRDGRLPRARLVQAVTRVLTLKERLGGFRQPAMSDVDTPAHRQAAGAAAQAATTVLRGPCRGPLVSGPVTVTAASGRDATRAWLAEALGKAGVPVVQTGGRVVHLVGYGDTRRDLAPSAAVTVAMDTPYLLGSARSRVLVATYSSSRPSMEALAAVLAGKAPAHGRSPVPVRGLPRSACG
jgi:beta-N-acetylhexosaminidase